jgi:hypothetical protein
VSPSTAFPRAPLGRASPKIIPRRSNPVGGWNLDIGIALGPAPALRADLGEDARELMPRVEAGFVEELDELLGRGEAVVTAVVGGHELRGFLDDGRVDAGAVDKLGGEAEEAFDGDFKARARLGELADLIGEEVDGLEAPKRIEMVFGEWWMCGGGVVG